MTCAGFSLFRAAIVPSLSMSRPVRILKLDSVSFLGGQVNTVRPHSACGGFPPAPEAIKLSPWFLRMPVLHGPPQVLGLT